jgi:membrane associated rhomboid family serine protease
MSTLGFLLLVTCPGYLFPFWSREAVLPGIIHWLAVPAHISDLVTRPWTIFTYMFLHEGFLAYPFQYFMALLVRRIFLEYLDGRKLFGVYILGGLAGAFLYILSFNLFLLSAQILPAARALGASAAVLAIVISISVYVPNYTITLLFLGPVKLKYIAAFMVVLDFISIAGDNPGGHIAHLGGALFGWFLSGNTGRAPILPGQLQSLPGRVSGFKPRVKMKVEYKKTAKRSRIPHAKGTKAKRIDDILDKISKSGYDSLTAEEKEILFRLSNKP